MPCSPRCGAPLLTAILIAAATAGCETFGPHPCDPTPAANPVQTFNGGTATDGVYMSSTWTGELLPFPGGTHYLIEHHLACPPAVVQPYLSFSEFATPDSGAAWAPAAGNSVELLGINCKTIEISNDTCSDYYLLLTAEGAPTSCDCPTP
jgi:hypothetical protein